MALFMKKGYFCVVDKGDETNEQFQMRGYLIVTQKPKKKSAYEKCEILTKYLVNKKYFGCVYDKEINMLCDRMEYDMMKEK